MHDYRKAESMLCNEVEDILREDELNPNTLEILCTALDGIKSIKKIKMLDEVSDYSEYAERQSYARRGGSYRGGSYDGGSSYARRRDSMGRFTRDSGSWRGYSRAEVKGNISQQIEDLMRDATNENERQALEQAMQSIQNA